jgi:hypothetical protein
MSQVKVPGVLPEAAPECLMVAWPLTVFRLSVWVVV